MSKKQQRMQPVLRRPLICPQFGEHHQGSRAFKTEGDTTFVMLVCPCGNEQTIDLLKTKKQEA